MTEVVQSDSLEDYEGAILDYRKAIEFNNKLPFIHNNLGSALRKKGSI